ncbi:nucleoside triphosphate pyrophosphohydrolase [Pleomorphomonas carboxyditropha]|uniref:Nucleoside triphosphate pyrophosphohydrolase n=1 Tax=Pleomorphomonas carboxyditropha TaxID=2023338 RepID=A0A2G9WU36_9HYPH|nr:nucleoside triphosphate pyrophosphohydrolase [Pleomorphomonas carboxyditropha]PIO98215.1 nucleoside triphosphate pyrophosphohydrolase [Pleomorphomonas carboxyditropha]
MQPGRDISVLIDIMARLRDPESGCAWDVQQTFETIAPYTIEEAYEVAEAIARGDRHDICDELGDLLLQVVFHARMAEEEGAFAFPDVVEAVTRKMIRRHPHVFGPAEARTPHLVKGLWEKIKAEEKAEKAARHGGEEIPPGLLDAVSVAMPPMLRAVKLQQKAGTVGFDWNDPRAVLAKIREELDELEAEMDRADSGKLERAEARAAIEAELGDVLFALANLGRHLDIDPEAAVRATNEKFRKRFSYIERKLGETGRRPQDATLEEMEALWQQAKTEG